MKNKVDILGVSISNITMREATQKVKEFVKTDSFHSVYTPNPEFVMLAQGRSSQTLP